MRPSFLHGNVFIGNAKHTASETNAVRLPAGTLVPVCAVAIEAGRVLVRHSLPHPQCEATSANGLKGLVSGGKTPKNWTWIRRASHGRVLDAHLTRKRWLSKHRARVFPE